jgi:precorrin-3B C17-methyltransferase
MITPRGYQRKYTLGKTEQPLKPHQRLQKEAEPWALEQTIEIKQEQQTEAVSSRDIAEQALLAVTGEEYKNEKSVLTQAVLSIFEVAVSSGVANKTFTPAQMIVIAEAAGEEGTITYTPDHYVKLQVPTDNPQTLVEKLTARGLVLSPIGETAKIKACDFCDGEKKDSIPYAEALQESLGSMELPKELKIGFNGCAMACYGAVHEDIGIVYRKGTFDLFLGGKTIGRNAHPGQLVAEGIPMDQLVTVVEKLIQEYKETGHPNERFFKFFKRKKNLQGFQHVDVTPKLQVEPAACGD